MERIVRQTSDGSTTIYLPEWEESYHSKHGAIQEAKHVFIKNGLDLLSNKSDISILEIGFGTGLNAFITYLEMLQRNLSIQYVGVEAYPISLEEIKAMNYGKALDAESESLIFNNLHDCIPNEAHFLHPNFEFTKRIQRFEEINDVATFDLIYFDAFGFRVQPDLWSLSIFEKMFTALKSGGILTTYACRTLIKKNMEHAGFRVQKKEGPPGKREMLVAYKD